MLPSMVTFGLGFNCSREGSFAGEVMADFLRGGRNSTISGLLVAFHPANGIDIEDSAVNKGEPWRLAIGLGTYM